MNETKNTGFFSSIAFIFSFAKKYVLGLIFIVFFIILTTFFQVMGPKVLGNAIDNLITYVGNYQIEKTIDDIEAGKGLTDKQKNNIISYGNFDKEQEENIKNASPEQLQNVYTLFTIRDEIFSYDNYSILDGNGFSKKQKNAIMDLDVDVKLKYVILGSSNIDIARSYLKNYEGITKEEKQKIDNYNIEEINDLYNYSTVRLEAIMLDSDSVTSKMGLTDEQIAYIDESNLTQEQKTEIKNLSEDELVDIYNTREVEINSEKDFKVFQRAILLLITLYVCLSLSMFVYSRIMAIVAANTTRDMRKGLFGKLEKLSIRFFDKSNAGDILSRFTNDIDNISNALNQSLTQVLSQVAMLIGIVFMMFNEDVSSVDITLFGKELVITNIIVWTMLTFAIVAILISMILIKKARFYVGKQQKKLGALNGYVDEVISGQQVVISYGLEEQSIEKFEGFNEDLRNTSVKGQIYSGILMPFMQGMGLVNLGTMVFLGAFFVIEGSMTVGLLIAFMQYSQRFFNPLAQVVAQYNMLELAATGAGRVKDVYDVEAEIVNSENAKDIDGINGKVSLKDIDFGYDEDKLVLKNINIEVNQGEMIALVGPTGSGKTTVMNLMNRFYDVNSGNIEFDGISIKDITLDSLRRNVGIVLQESLLFKGTISENIAYGNKNASKEEIINAAKTANIHEFIMTLDKGYDTKVDNNTSAFSTGQKQLMSIARTILTNPDLLILDEATSNVDTVTEAKIQKAMENVLKDRTSFVIAHRLKTILNADKIIVLKDGEIIEQGSHHELLKQEGFYSELYHNQFVVE